jgi:hypothetical protein
MFLLLVRMSSSSSSSSSSPSSLSSPSSCHGDRYQWPEECTQSTSLQFVTMLLTRNVLPEAAELLQRRTALEEEVDAREGGDAKVHHTILLCFPVLASLMRRGTWSAKPVFVDKGEADDRLLLL